MKILREIQDKYFVRYLRHKSRLDGRLVTIGCLTLYFVFLFTYPLPYYKVWNLLGVPARPYPFADLRVITSGLECYRLGYNVYLENPCNPWPVFSEFNYPKIWLLLSNLGLNSSHTKLLAMIIIAVFFIIFFSIIGRLNYTEGLIYGSFICSSSAMLAIERANNDLIIFIILGASLLLIQKKTTVRFFSYFLILLAAILKIYPIFCLTILLKEKQKAFFAFLSFLSGIFTIYIASELDNIKQVSKATPQMTSWSYGFKIIFEVAYRDLSKVLHRIGITKEIVHNTLHSGNFNKWLPLFEMIVVILATSYFIYSLLTLFRVLYSSLDKENRINQDFINAFRVGATIFVGTFLIANNWAYRLIFLIFAMPQILAWIKNRNPISLISCFALIGIIITLWTKIPLDGLGIYFNQSIDWLLFFYFSFTLILTLPDWIKNWWRNDILFLRANVASYRELDQQD